MGELGRHKDQIRTWIMGLLEPKQIVEIRGIDPFRSRTFSTGIAGELDRMVEFTVSCSGDCRGVYYTPNPLASNKSSGEQNTAKDKDITKRNWLLIDIDSVREPNTNASDMEHEAASQVAQNIIDVLHARKFQGVVVADSGNGWHVMVPIDLPNVSESRELCKEALHLLQQRFGTDQAKVDETTYNAARIWKMPGTLARKGEPTEERPHRRAKITILPANVREHAAENTGLLKKMVSEWGYAKIETRGAEAYLKAAVEKEVGGVVSAPVSTRNNRLNTAAFNLGQLVSGADLDRRHVEYVLLNAARGVGLPEKEALTTIKSGIEAGITKPRIVPSSSPTPGDWDEPLPISNEEGLLPFPVDVFPREVQTFINQTSWALNVPADYVGLMVLCVAGGAIGNTRRVIVKKSYQNSAAIYGCFVARPGSKKSAVVKIVGDPIFKAQRRYDDEARAAKERWENEGKNGVEPRGRECFTTSGTKEGITRLLSRNDHGVLLIADELSGFIAGLNQYKSGGKGDDRQFFLSCWDQQVLKIERAVKENCLTIHRPFLAICGGIQPDVLPSIRGESKGGFEPPDDGFFDRFLVAYPPEPEPCGENWRDIDDATLVGWEKIVEGLLGLEREVNGGPVLVPLDMSAKAAFEQYTHRDAEERKEPGFPDQLRGPWSKLIGYYVRFALILQMMDSVSGDYIDGYSINATVMDRAARLTDYFKSHCRKAKQMMAKDHRAELGNKILDWAIRTGRTNFGARELFRHYFVKILARQKVMDALEFLEQSGSIRKHIDRQQVTSEKGRKKGPSWDINPAILAILSPLSDDLQKNPHSSANIAKIEKTNATLNGEKSYVKS